MPPVNDKLLLNQSGNLLLNQSGVLLLNSTSEVGGNTGVNSYIGRKRRAARKCAWIIFFISLGGL